jgi:nitroimidazol reductase NimA-like FMN-containing flavoprotein (pyridoxamine 5'-phosphate oxidase superfamily)
MNETKNKSAAARTAMPVVPRKGVVSIPARLTKLDRVQRHAVLATSSAAGPHASLVAFVLTKDGKGIVFATPKATVKYRNMQRDARVSLLIDSRKNDRKDYRGAEAMTISGRAKEVPEGIHWARLATLLVSKHPELASFVAAPTSALMLVTIRRCVHVGKFQEVTQGGV